MEAYYGRDWLDLDKETRANLICLVNDCLDSAIKEKCSAHSKGRFKPEHLSIKFKPREPLGEYEYIPNDDEDNKLDLIVFISKGIVSMMAAKCGIATPDEIWIKNFRERLCRHINAKLNESVDMPMTAGVMTE